MIIILLYCMFYSIGGVKNISLQAQFYPKNIIITVIRFLEMLYNHFSFAFPDRIV